MHTFYDSGLPFTCTQCGYCCGHEPGYVFLSAEDLKVLTDLFSISRAVFIETYCVSVDFGSFFMISLRETEEHDCIFLEGKRCRAYAARPLQCRSYPFWPTIVESAAAWQNEGTHCPGIGKGERHAKNEIEHWLYLHKKERPLQINHGKDS